MDFLYWLQSIANPFLDFIFENISLLFNQTLLITIVCYLYWCYDKKVASKLAISFFASGLFVQTMKIVFRIPRPWILDSRIQPTEKMMETATGYSFPSGHTQTATSICYGVVENFKKSKLKYVFIVFPFLMMFSRMYVRVLSPLDVTVSFIVSSLVVFTCIYLLNKDYEKYMKMLCYVFSLIAVCGLIYAMVIVNNGVSTYVLVKDAIKTYGAVFGFALGMVMEMKYLNFEVKKRTLKENIIIIFIGLIGTLTMKSGLKFVLPEHMFSDVFRYFMTIFWVMFLYPAIFTHYKK